MTEDQKSIFDDLDNQEDWMTDAEKIWDGMPEFNQDDRLAKQQIIVSFDSFKDVKEFARLLNLQKVTPSTKSTWFPYKKILDSESYRYVTDEEK